MQKLKSFIPHIAAVFIMLAVAYIYFLPALSGKVIEQYDNLRAYGMQGEMKAVKKETGTWPLWTNGPFAGMPTFQILGVSDGNKSRLANKVFMFNKGVTDSEQVIFVAFVCFYLLLLSFKVDWRLALMGAIAYGLCTYNIILADAGHSTKLLAMAYAPGVLAGVIWIFKEKYFLGAGVMGLFLSLEFYANHLQITYYLIILIGLLWIFKAVEAFRKSEGNKFLKMTAILAAIGLLGASTSLTRVWTTSEYGEETIRGGSDLAANEGRTGLSKDYAFDWSYGVGETFTLMFPNYMGGGTARKYDESETFKTIGQNIVQQVMSEGKSRKEGIEAAHQWVGAHTYWGDQRSTAGPVYYGAIVCFLFFLGAFLVRGPVKWWLITSTVLFIMLSWGKNFPALNYTLFDYFPLYNKFRSVSMILGVAQIMAVLLGILGLKNLFDKNIGLSERKKALISATGIAVGLGVIVLFVCFSVSMDGLRDDSLNEQIVSMLKADRQSMLMNNVFRSLLFVGLAAGLLWLFLQEKLKSAYVIPAIGLLMLIDVWSVDWKYLDHGKFKEKTAFEAEQEPTQADKDILTDPDPFYRVLDVARGGLLNNTTASFFHKSLSGYHAAKLVLYQEMLERYMFNSPFEHEHILDMLNTKYVINADRQTGQLVPIQRSTNLGNAWFVHDLQIVQNADEELNALATLDPANKVIVQQRFADYLEGLELKPDSLSSPENNIELTNYHPDKMTYSYKADNEQLAVFSDIYYPPSKGWKAYIDDQEVEGFIKANYAFRAMRLPAGEHTLELRFRPRSYYVGERVSLIASLLVIFLFIGSLFVTFRKFDSENYSAVTITDPEPKKVETEKVKPTKRKSKVRRKKK
ncbi:MAG: YfhO family protein [Bacteroidota bacterium]